MRMTRPHGTHEVLECTGNVRNPWIWPEEAQKYLYWSCNFRSLKFFQNGKLKNKLVL